MQRSKDSLGAWDLDRKNTDYSQVMCSSLSIDNTAVRDNSAYIASGWECLVSGIGIGVCGL